MVFHFPQDEHVFLFIFEMLDGSKFNGAAAGGNGVLDGIRTRVTAVKGRCPGPG